MRGVNVDGPYTEYIGAIFALNVRVCRVHRCLRSFEVGAENQMFADERCANEIVAQSIEFGVHVNVSWSD